MAEQNAVATQASLFTPEQVDLLKRTIAKDATNDELTMFVQQCNRTGLDPFARQIYFLKRPSKNGSVVSIQTSIDGMRLIAQRSGEYAGQDKPVWELDEKGKIVCAEVTVYKFSKNETRYAAATGVAFWEEYKPVAGQDFMWQKMPRTMIAKCAEALALRKAFPQELSGLYSQEEMAQSEIVDITPKKVKDTKMSKEQSVKMKELIKESRITKEQISDLVSGKSAADLSHDEAAKLIEHLENIIRINDEKGKELAKKRDVIFFDKGELEKENSTNLIDEAKKVFEVEDDIVDTYEKQKKEKEKSISATALSI